MPWAGTGLCQLPPRAIPFPASLDLQGKAPGGFHQETSWVLPQHQGGGQAQGRTGSSVPARWVLAWAEIGCSAEHGGGGGRSSAGWEALVSWGWEEGGSGAD